MQNNSNASENNKSSVTIDSILDDIGTSKSTEGASNKFDDAMKNLDKIFEDSHAENLAWLDNILNESSDTNKKEAKITQEEPVEEENPFTEEEDSAPEEEIPFTEDEDDGENSGEIRDDIITAENADTDESEEEADTPSDIHDEDTFEAENTDEDDDTKIYTPAPKAKPEDAESDDGEIDFDDFEGDNSPEIGDTESEDSSPVAKQPDVNSSLGKLFGLSTDDDDEETEKERKKKKSEHNKIAKELGAYEEINMADPDAVNKGQRHYYLKKCRALISLVGAAFFLLVGLYLELGIAGTFSLPSFLSVRNNPAFVALIDLQVMCFSAICVLDSLVQGFWSALDRRFSPASCTLTVFTVCTLHAIITVILASSVKVNMFCCMGCLSILALAVYNYLRASADDKAYRIASSVSNKYGAYELGTNSLECSPFASHINLEKAKVISVCKGSVYEGFVGRNDKRPEDEKKLGKMTFILAIIALLVGIFVAVFTTDISISEKIYAGMTGLTIILVSSIPINTFFVSALPKFIATKLGKSINATLIGQNASEEYKGLSVVAFEDTEVFLPKDVRISIIKTYGGMALDEAVIIMSKIYGKIGGPLSKIFTKIVDTKSQSSEVKLVKVYPDAIEVNVDGRDVCLATASYLGANGIRIITDSADSSFEQSHGSILFMVCGGRILAKFYIKYSMNPSFEKTLRELHDANLCVGVKTLDPCINNDLVFGGLEKANYALSVIKGNSASDIPAVKTKVSSGVIALGSVHNFLEMLLICERTGRNVKINNVIKIISAVMCAALSALMMITNGSLDITFCLIIQLFWLIPVAAVSYFNK